MRKLNLAFAGCGFLGLYQTGVVAALSYHGRTFLKDVDRISGASSGSLHATMLICDSPLDKCIEMSLKTAGKIRSNAHKIIWQNLDAEVRAGLDAILPENAHTLASSRLFVSVTSLEAPASVKNRLVSEFDSRDDLINVLAQSCFIPFYSGFEFPRHEDGTVVIDGAYTDNLPVFEGYKNIRVSPFSSSSADISPEEDKSTGTFEVIYKNMPFAFTSNNIRKIIKVVVPATNTVMRNMYISGYQDAKLYLKQHGCFEAGPSPQVLHLFDDHE